MAGEKVWNPFSWSVIYNNRYSIAVLFIAFILLIFEIKLTEISVPAGSSAGDPATQFRKYLYNV